MASGIGLVLVPFSVAESLNHASPREGLVKLAFNGFGPLFSRTGALNAEAPPLRLASNANRPLISSLKPPLSSAWNTRSLRSSAFKKPSQTALNLLAGKKGVGDFPAST